MDDASMSPCEDSRTCRCLAWMPSGHSWGLPPPEAPRKIKDMKPPAADRQPAITWLQVRTSHASKPRPVSHHQARGRAASDATWSPAQASFIRQPGADP